MACQRVTAIYSNMVIGSDTENLCVYSGLPCCGYSAKLRSTEKTSNIYVKLNSHSFCLRLISTN